MILVVILLCAVNTYLLSNAVKYTKSGQVSLTLKRLSDDDSGFTLYVAVKDTGIGIHESEMDKLYSAFDRLDLENTRSIEGSGLGLAITRKMLNLMGSDIKVESEYGKGSLFYFNLHQKVCDNTPIGPYEPGKTTGTPRRKAATFTAKDARILIVDDTPSDIPKAIADIAELIIQKGLDYCGDVEDYLDALSTFKASAASKADKLEELLSSGDAQNLTLLIHSLKSTSGAIGATALSQKAAQMEKSPTDEGVTELIRDYRSLIARLDTAI